MNEWEVHLPSLLIGRECEALSHLPLQRSGQKKECKRGLLLKLLCLRDSLQLTEHYKSAKEPLKSNDGNLSTPPSLTSAATLY